MVGEHVFFAMPIRIDGIGMVNIGDYCSLGYQPAIRLGNGEILLQARERNSIVLIGNRCSFSNNIFIIARTQIELGEGCLVGDRVTIMDADFHEIDPRAREKGVGSGETAAVKIGNNCWIGTDAMILKGVTVGDDSIIAPKSVVTKSFPAKSIIAGVPATLVRSLDA